MCVIAAPLAAAGAASAGAAAGGISLGTVLTTVGTLASIGGTLYAAQTASREAEAYARDQERLAAAELAMGQVEDQRTRDVLRRDIGRMLAQMAARGIQLDSPSALALGEEAARELSFASQSARSGATARSETRTSQARQSRALAQRSLIEGGFSAAGQALTAAPELWPELADRRVLS